MQNRIAYGGNLQNRVYEIRNRIGCLPFASVVTRVEKVSLKVVLTIEEKLDIFGINREKNFLQYYNRDIWNWKIYCNQHLKK